MEKILTNFRTQEFIHKAKVGDEIKVSDNGNLATIVQIDVPNLLVYIIWNKLPEATHHYNIDQIALIWEIVSK